MTARGIVYLRHAPKGGFAAPFSPRFSTARKSILILVTQSFFKSAPIELLKVARI